MEIANRLVSVMKQFLKVKKERLFLSYSNGRGFHGFSLNYFLSGRVFVVDLKIFWCFTVKFLYNCTLKPLRHKLPYQQQNFSAS
jgi:hypothetical protein